MEVKNNYNQYAEYKEKQDSLAKMMLKAADVISDLNMQQHNKVLSELGEKVQNETFKIQVVGTFKNGKSTFINSFLGEDVLPAYSLPCTAVINEVKWGEKKKAVIHFRNPLPETLPASIPTLALEHMNKFNNKDVPPLEIPYDCIEDYAVIPFGADPKEMLLESPYEKIELFWPLPLLENGIEIIDSPGLNEHATRTKVTMEYLSKADAILFVLNAQALCSQEEMRFIENNLKLQGFTDPFFVVNRFDVIAEREREMMKRFAKQKLSGYSTNELFFVSALQALNGKIDNNAELYATSGMKEFEACLSEFLTKGKGKAKLSQPARELKRILNDEALFKVIPNQRNLLATSLDDVKARYDKVKPELENLKLKREKLYNKIMLRIEQVKPEFRSALSRNYTNLINTVPAWLEEAKVTTKISMIPKKHELEAVVKEISDAVVNRVEKQQLEWQNSVLEPLISEKYNEIFGVIDSDLEDFYKKLEAINVDMSGKRIAANEKSDGEKIAAAITGFVFGGPAGLVSGSSGGFSMEIVKSVALGIGSILLLEVFALCNPITIIASFALNAVFAGIKNEEKAVRQIKDKLSEEFVKQLSEKTQNGLDSLVNGIVERFAEQSDKIVGALDSEIAEAETQITGIIGEMEKGQDNIRKRTAVIDKCESDAKILSIDIDKLIFCLI